MLKVFLKGWKHSKASGRYCSGADRQSPCAPDGPDQATTAVRDAYTIHQFLMRHGWLNPENFALKLAGGNQHGAPTVIIDEASMIPMDLLGVLFRAWTEQGQPPDPGRRSQPTAAHRSWSPARRHHRLARSRRRAEEVSRPADRTRRGTKDTRVRRFNWRTATCGTTRRPATTKCSPVWPERTWAAISKFATGETPAS